MSFLMSAYTEGDVENCKVPDSPIRNGRGLAIKKKARKIEKFGKAALGLKIIIE